MLAIYIVISIIIIIFACWVLMIKPAGKKHPYTEDISEYIYAHRGLHNKDEGIPENSMAAFRLAADRGYGIELDLHLSADSTPVVMHDTSLMRTAGKEIDIFTILDTDIKKYPLDQTEERIPFFREVLEETAGRVPLLIELKIDNNNYAKLCEAAICELKDYDGVYAIQSFDPRAVRYLKKKHPWVMRGQLAGYLRKSGDDLQRFLDFGLRNLITNFLTKPHFIAYRVQDTAKPSMKLCRMLYSPLEFNWTCRKKAHHVKAHKNRAIPIFEKYIP